MLQVFEAGIVIVLKVVCYEEIDVNKSMRKIEDPKGLMDFRNVTKLYKYWNVNWYYGNIGLCVKYEI
jgi:hypothetical protein